MQSINSFSLKENRIFHVSSNCKSNGVVQSIFLSLNLIFRPSLKRQYQKYSARTSHEFHISLEDLLIRGLVRIYGHVSGGPWGVRMLHVIPPANQRRTCLRIVHYETVLRERSKKITHPSIGEHQTQGAQHCQIVAENRDKLHCSQYSTLFSRSVE